MPRYHFNVQDGSSFVDREGTELADLAAAQRNAVALAGQMLLEHAEAFWNGEDWRMEVTDANGLTLFVLNFFATKAPALLGPSHTSNASGAERGPAKRDPA